MFAQVVAPAFGRREPRLRSRAYLLGLVSGLESKLASQRPVRAATRAYWQRRSQWRPEAGWAE
jgi:hypothetical protein